LSVPRRVALLTGFIAPFRIALFKELEQRCRELRIFVIAPVEPGRTWSVDSTGLPLSQQRSIAIRGLWRHPHHFSEPLAIQIPYDTVPQLMRLHPEVIISLELGARTLQAAAYRAVARKSRLVIWAAVSEANEQGRGRMRQLLRRVLLRSADAVIVNGRSGARYVQHLGAGEAKIFHAPQTTAIAPFLAVPTSRDTAARRRLLYCGQLIERKGLIPFLAHLSQWCRENPASTVEMWFAGDGPLRSQLTQFPVPFNLEVRFLGPVAYDRLPEVYGQAGMLVFPTLADEWGLVVIEAMAAGLPVLGSLFSQAVEDLVTDTRNGWTFRPDDQVGVRSAINRALGASDAEIQEMGFKARQRVRTLTPEAMADNMMAAVEYALTHRS